MSLPAIGVLTLEIYVEHSQSLKDKRQVVKSLKDRLRDHFNVAVAEIGHLDSWQTSAVSVVTVANDRVFAEKVLQAAEKHASDLLGGSLVGSVVEWL